MIKQICILTKSYKHGGYCVAAIEISTKEWIRLVNSDDPKTDEIRKEQMYLNGKTIDCLDVVEYDFIKNISNSCQTENWLLNTSVKPKYIRTISIEELAKIIKLEKDKCFIFDKAGFLSVNEISNIKRSLYIFHVQNLKIDASTYESYGEIRFRYKCSFDYNNNQYDNISLTDPIYRDLSQNGINISNALVIASLPCIPYTDNLYYKFVAKIIPIDPEIFAKNEGFIKIRKEGFFYSVSGNDALLLNKYFGYKLYGQDIIKTGFPVKGGDAIFSQIDKLSINYEVYKSNGIPVISKRFDDNNYEIIDNLTYVPNTRSPKYEYFNIKRSELLKNLANGTNPITGEISNFIDSKTRLALLDIAKIIEGREKSDNGFKVKISDFEE